MDDDTIPPRPGSYDRKVALVLQGGGALGSYQAGVYEALAASDYLPDWVAGISIGAIIAAIIAGNAPEQRVEKLRQFWTRITAPPARLGAWGAPALTGCPSTAARMARPRRCCSGKRGSSRRAPCPTGYSGRRPRASTTPAR